VTLVRLGLLDERGWVTVRLRARGRPWQVHLVDHEGKHESYEWPGVVSLRRGPECRFGTAPHRLSRQARGSHPARVARGLLKVWSMKTIILTSLLTVAATTNTFADSRAVAVSAPAESRLAEAEREETRAFVALKAARDQVSAARARWDAAVADDDPVQAGKWARRHFDAMQVRSSALARWRTAAEAVNTARRASVPSH
jgi:hypothetical protein